MSFRWLLVVRYTAVSTLMAFCLAGYASAQSNRVAVGSEAGETSAAESSADSAQLQVFGEGNTLPSDAVAEGIGTSRRYGEEGGGPFRNIANFIGDRIALDFGAGFNAPIGNDIPYITWGGNFTIGGGVHLNKRATTLAKYQFIGDKLPGGLIAEAGTQGGHAHIWSFTLDPVIDLFPERADSIYIAGGGGFYRKVTSFTEPGQYQNYVVGHFSPNQGRASFRIWHHPQNAMGNQHARLCRGTIPVPKHASHHSDQRPGNNRTHPSYDRSEVVALIAR